MPWSQFSIKIVGVHFGNSALSLRGNKITVNQLLWSKLRYVGQIYTEKILKRVNKFLWSNKTITKINWA